MSAISIDSGQRRMRDETAVWRADQQVPSYISCLTAPGALLASDDATRRVAALLETGEREAQLFWSNRVADKDVFITLTARAQRAGFRIVKVWETTPDLISVFYGQSTAPVVDKYRGEQQERLDTLVSAAITAEASDIHINVQASVTRVFFRVHGDLVFHRAFSGPEGMDFVRGTFEGSTEADSRRGAPLFNAKKDISASIAMTVRARVGNEYRMVPLKLRWQSIPSYPDGVTVVLRLLAQGIEGRVRTLEQLGYLGPQAACLADLIRKPTGLIAMSGATGSGKSTSLATLASMYQQVYKGRRLMRTIEDPVETVIAGADQHSVFGGGDGDSPWARLLRACMRGDPNALYVGEMRDPETANLTMQAVQTGHLVLATVHARTPHGAIERMIQLGMERSEMASDNFLQASIHQTLLPTLCPVCKVSLSSAPELLPPHLFAYLEQSLPGRLDQIHLRGHGCDACRQMGVSGRTVVAQILTPDIEQQWMILEKQPLHAYAYWRGRHSKRYPNVQGFDLIDHALEHIASGRVSPVDADLDLGGLDQGGDWQEQHAWYQRHAVRRMTVDNH